MKKSFLGLLAGALLVLSMGACGEKLLTPEQVTAEVQKGFDAGKAAVEAEMDSKCSADLEARVTAEVERMKAEAEAQKTAQ